MIFTFLSFATCSTIDLVITITSPSETPAFLRINRPHSFRAKAASSTRRFVARATSARVQSILTCVSAPPSSLCVVSNTRSVVNIGSMVYYDRWNSRFVREDAPLMDFKGIMHMLASMLVSDSTSPSKPFVRFFFLVWATVSISPDSGLCMSGNEATFLIDKTSGDRTESTRLW